ncbi:MAG: DNA adenine methylase [Bacteroidales bacterium]|nr:DNA adenine methylase [Bacteroidales bacterium]
MLKSPLRYPGGKSRAVDRIAMLIPEYKEYREPFLGGGSVFFYLKQRYPNRKYWVNDLHKSLFSFWSNCKYNLDELIKQVWKWRNEYSEGKALYKFLNTNIGSFNDLELAAAFFIYNRITFSGTSESGGYSEAAFKGRFTVSSIERLNNLDSLLSDTLVTNSDYQQVVQVAGKDVFIFLDPPYYSSVKSSLYGKNGNLHKNFDHYRFAEVMKKCEHKWLLTYDDSPFIRDAFSFANVMSWNLTYGMRNQTPCSDQTGKELFISNYLKKLPEEQQIKMFAEEKRVKYKKRKLSI